ncbi:hypothetical protein SAMN04489740_0943 [Arthrobacter alpinus]|uniref:Uncharacterized protein n=1 Tax=Arthrobacter alpinus TaxID=656366 RepID=A0A1H5H724_9MICC|nr:hypothetical protein [Arthrobacter alpinus]SEE23720.1 hypothetical protein SAMN04489740_0943 [Arthrobacter alpinus]
MSDNNSSEQSNQTILAGLDPNIVRMYKKDDAGALVFREAWVESFSGEETDGADAPETYFVVNHGTVGHVSTSKEVSVETLEEAEGMLAAFTEQCITDGYAVLAREEQSLVVAQFALKSDRVSDRDKHLANRVKETLTAHLAWRGSGVLEKMEFNPAGHGLGKLNVYIVAPDAARAVANVKVCIREEKLDFTKLTVATGPIDDPSALRAKHSPTGGTAFSL